MYKLKQTHRTHVFVNSHLLCILQTQLKKFIVYKYNTVRPKSVWQATRLHYYELFVRQCLYAHTKLEPQTAEKIT